MRKTALFLVLGLTLGCLIVAGVQKGAVAQAPPQGVKADAPGQPPPDLKVGDRVAFGGHASSLSQWQSTDGNKSPVVVAVKGNWVQLGGVRPEGYGFGGQPCWVNFDTVAWYVVLK